jgi:hypothetical protein
VTGLVRPSRRATQKGRAIFRKAEYGDGGHAHGGGLNHFPGWPPNFRTLPEKAPLRS